VTGQDLSQTKKGPEKEGGLTPDHARKEKRLGGQGGLFGGGKTNLKGGGFKFARQRGRKKRVGGKKKKRSDPGAALQAVKCSHQIKERGKKSPKKKQGTGEGDYIMARCKPDR